MNQNNVHELRVRSADTEKLTINLGFVDLGHIDLMVQEGFYTNRSDCIRASCITAACIWRITATIPSSVAGMNWP
ncbi:MAG: hypothetical protein ABL897_15960, partial [Hyphomicrobium sp.]